MARRAETVAGDFRRLKLKLGGRDGLDVERVRAVRGVTDLPLQVDVNEYWELDEALDAVRELAGLGVQYVEQPLEAGDPGGPRLKRESPLPIYVDEDVHMLPTVAECAERAHGVNIKLAKSGGIREAVRMAHAARALGLGVMLGCMIESGLGISAAAQIGSLCDHVDLDGNLLLAEDPWPGVAFVDGVQVPSDQPDWESMKRYLALAEGYSGDDHYGKTTYGIIRYGSEPVVAVLDSERVGESVEGVPVVGTVADALAYEPTTALVGVAVAGGRLPPVWRGILRRRSRPGWTSRRACTSSSPTTRSSPRSPRSTAPSSATTAGRRPTLAFPPART